MSNVKRYYRLLIFIYALNLLDLVSTLWFLKLGYEEGNKIMAPILNYSLLLASILKIIIPIGLLYISYRVYLKYSHLKKFRVVAFSTIFFIIFLYIVVVSMNSSVIISHYLFGI